MFVLDTKKCTDFDLAKAEEFVGFWANYYSSKTKIHESNEVISYIKELNLRNELTRENVARLLRWKDPRMLTGKTHKSLVMVNHVLDKLEYINLFRFRKDKIDEAKFLKNVKAIFPNGFIWRVFLFHIARPYEFPIADRNVFLSFSILTNNEIPKDLEGYKNYKAFFFNISKSAGFIKTPPTGNESNICKIVADLKKVDNALFVFGKFINAYVSNYNSTKSKAKKKGKM